MTTSSQAPTRWQLETRALVLMDVFLDAGWAIAVPGILSTRNSAWFTAYTTADVEPAIASIVVEGDEIEVAGQSGYEAKKPHDSRVAAEAVLRAAGLGEWLV